MTDEKPDPNRLQPFDEFIREAAGGIPADEMTAAIAAVTQEVIHLKKKGTVQLTIEITPADDAGQQVYVSSRVKTTPPEPKPFPALFYAGGGGSLHREDPYRSALPGMARTPEEQQPRLPAADTNPGDDAE